MSAALWTVKAMADAMQAHVRGPVPAFVGGLSIDSRTLQPGDAFFAITGDRDGHDYVASALAAKAGLAVVAQAKMRAIRKRRAASSSSRTCSRACARSGARRASVPSAKVIGVTGSVGKTGTKEALKLALSQQGATHASAASYNNHWGVPLSLARCPAETRYAIFEMGMNHAGEIGPLAQLVRPQIAIITGHRARASGIFQVARRHRRRQSRNLRGRRAGRRGRAQSRQRAFRAPREESRGGENQHDRVLRRA